MFFEIFISHILAVFLFKNEFYKKKFSEMLQYSK